MVVYVKGYGSLEVEKQDIKYVTETTGYLVVPHQDGRLVSDTRFSVSADDSWTANASSHMHQSVRDFIFGAL